MSISPLPEHGVLIRLNTMGIYFIGDSGSGKSETALQLIHQGAQLVCDDAPELSLKNNTIIGTCPDGFHGKMHIHDLGIINIKKVIGQHAFVKQSKIDFVFNLTKTKTYSPCSPRQLLYANQQQWQFQQCFVSGIGIHLYPNRDIATIINTAINYYLF